MPASLVGQSLGPYRLEELIGLGGMGEVYRARDERLDRIVAVKVLPRSFVVSPDRVRRFEREAHAASSINHPHIATIHDVGYENGLHFIAMEYVEGLSLSTWLASEGLALNEVLVVFEQVADALARAHEAGVLHRDVKPANVIVTRKGDAKLVDFGLAKVTGESGEFSDSDVRSGLSRSGLVLGTLAYMSPEQARGRKLDRRTDIFSFGVMLYEAVAARPPFSGESGIEAVSAVLRDDPIPRLRDHPGIPTDLVRVIAKALQKDPARRYQYMDDLLVDLRAVRRAVEAGEAEAGEGEASKRHWLWAAAGLLGGLLGGWSAWRLLSEAPPSAPILRAGVVLRPLTQGGALHRGPAISPNGDLVTYASDREGSFDIVVQQVGVGRPLRVTEDTGDELDPVFSPDGQTLAFATGDGTVRIVPALGGLARTLAEGGAHAPVWSPDGERVLYRGRRGLFTVSRTGGPSRPVIENPAFPVLDRATWSPDGRSIVFPSAGEGRYGLARVGAEGGAAVLIGTGLQALGSPVFSGDGRWIFGTASPLHGRGNEIWAVPVGRDGSLRAPERVLGGVLEYDAPSVSRDQRRIVFEVQDIVTSLGRIPLSGAEPREPSSVPIESRFFEAEVSHAGDTLVVVSDRGGGPSLWRMASQGGSLTRLHGEPGSDEHPAWSYDDHWIAFSHVADGHSQIAVLPATGGKLRFVSRPGTLAGYPAWSPDGNTLAFVTLDAEGGAIRAVAPGGGRERVVATTPQRFRRVVWSPDGKWLAASVRSERGGWSIGVTPASGGALREVLPNARAPLWLPDGRLVFAREGHPGSFDLWSIALSAEATPLPGSERRLTELPRGRSVDRERGASSDGRFLHVPIHHQRLDDIWLGEAR